MKPGEDEKEGRDRLPKRNGINEDWFGEKFRER